MSPHDILRRKEASLMSSETLQFSERIKVPPHYFYYMCTYTHMYYAYVYKFVPVSNRMTIYSHSV